MVGLCVSIDYQGRGFGSALQRWSLDQATAESMSIVLKSSPVGVMLDEKHGLKAHQRHSFGEFLQTGYNHFHITVWEPPGSTGKLYESVSLDGLGAA